MALPTIETTPETPVLSSSPVTAVGRKRKPQSPSLLPSGFPVDRELQQLWHDTGLLPYAKPSKQRNLHREWVQKGLIPVNDSPEAIAASAKKVNEVILVTYNDTDSSSS